MLHEWFIILFHMNSLDLFLHYFDLSGVIWGKSTLWFTRLWSDGLSTLRSDRVSTLWYDKESWIRSDGIYWCVSGQSLSALTCVVRTLQVCEYISRIGIYLSPDVGWQTMKAWNCPVLVWWVFGLPRVRWRAKESKTGAQGILCGV